MQGIRLVLFGGMIMDRRRDCNRNAHPVNITTEILIREFLDWAHIKVGDRVLDVGTGTGELLPYLTQRVGDTGEITAIDRATDMIRIAKRKYPERNIRFIAGDIMETELPIVYFDCVLCYSVFHCFPSAKLAIAKLKSFLKYNGILAICHPTGRRNINTSNRRMNMVSAPDSHPEIGTLLKYLKSSGLLPLFAADSERIFAMYAKKVTPY